MLFTITNRESALRVFYDKNRTAISVEPGKSVVADLDEETARTIEERARAGIGLRIAPAGAADKPSIKASNSVADGRNKPEATLTAQKPKTAPTPAPKAEKGQSVTDAANLLVEAKSGMAWFSLRLAARKLLGKDWPGSSAKRSDVIKALEKMSNG